MQVFSTNDTPAADASDRPSLALVPAPSTAWALELPATVPASRHPALVYLARLAPGSRRVQRFALDRIAATLTAGRCDALSLDWTAVRYEHATAVRAVLAAELAPATANRHLSALRGVLKECWRLGYVDAETYQRAADLEAVRGSRLPKGRALQPGEVHALFAACDRSNRLCAIRDAAIYAVLYGLGLRREEAVTLDWSSYDKETGAVKIRGKGNKERLGYLHGGGKDALDEWLAVRGEEDGPLFLPINKGGRLGRRRLSPEGIRYIADRGRRAAAVAPFSPHDLRRTFIGDLLDAGADLSTVQQLAGHAQVSTTARYDRRGEATKRRAAGLLHVPHRRRGGADRA